MSGQEDSPITLLDSDDDLDDVITDSITITRSVNPSPSRQKHSHVAAILTAPVSSDAYITNDSVSSPNKSSAIKQALVNGSIHYPTLTLHYHPQHDTQSPTFHNPPSSTQRELTVNNEQTFYQTQICPSDQGIQNRNDHALNSQRSIKQCSQMMRQTTVAPEVVLTAVPQKGTFSNIGDQTKLLGPRTANSKLSELVECIVDQSYMKPGTASDAAADPHRSQVQHSVSRSSTPDSVIIESVEGPCVDASKIPVTAIQAAETLQAQIKSRHATPSIKILESFSLRDCPINSKHYVEMASEETVVPLETSKTDASPNPQPSKAIISPPVKTNQTVKPSNHTLLNNLCQKRHMEMASEKTAAPFETSKTDTSPNPQPSKALLSPSIQTNQSVKPSKSILLSNLCQKAFYQCCVGECEHRSINPSEFQDHLHSSHPNAEEFPCVHCGDIAPSAQLLIQHLHHHADNNSNFQCNYHDCKFVTSHPDSFTRHFYHCHNRADRHLCLLCGQLFQTALEMLVHMKANFLNIVKCPHCSAKDVTKKNIMRHMSKSHPDTGRLVTVSRQIVCRERLKNGWPVLQNGGRDQRTNGSQEFTKTQVITTESVSLPPMEDVKDGMSKGMPVMEEAPSVCMDKFVPIMSVWGSDDGILVKKVKCEDDLEENDQHCNEMPVLERMNCATNLSESDKVPRGASSSFVPTTMEMDCDVDVKKDGIDSDNPVTRKNCQQEKESASSETNAERDSGKDERFVFPSSDAKKNKSLLKVHVCSKCDFYTTSVGQIYRHVREVHKMEDMFQCSECHGYLCQDDVIPHHVKYHPDSDENYIPTALRHAFNIRYMKKSRYRKSSAQLEVRADTLASINPMEDVTSRLMAKLSEAKEGDRLKLTSFESSILNKIINEKQITASVVSGHHKPDVSQVSVVKEATIPMIKTNHSRKKRHVSKCNKGSRKRQRLEIQETTQEGTEDKCQKEQANVSGEADTLQEISEDDYRSDDDTHYNDPNISKAIVKLENISPNRKSSASQAMSPKISKSPVRTPLKKNESPLEPLPKKNQSPVIGPSLKYQSPMKGPSPIKNNYPLRGCSPNNCLSSVDNPSEKASFSIKEMHEDKDPYPSCYQTPRKEPVDEPSIAGSPLPVKQLSPIKGGSQVNDGIGPNLTFSQVDFDDPSYEFRCKYCTYRKGSLDRFLHHTYYHFHYRPYTCGFCNFKAFSHNRVLTHIKADHPTKAANPVVKRVENEKAEARCQKTAMICFIPKHIEDVSLRRRIMMKKERQLKRIKSEKSEVKTKTSKSVQQNKQSNKHVKTKLKVLKTSSVKLTNKAEKEGSYLCPYCRTNRPLMTWTKLAIEICYHIHYKPLKCNYCDELQSASMYCVQKHIEKVHPGKEVIAKEERDPQKEKRMKVLLQRAIEISQKYRQELKRQELSSKSKKVKKKRAIVAGHPTKGGCEGQAVSDVTVGNISCSKQTNLNSDSAVNSISKNDSTRTSKTGEACVISKDTAAPKVHCSEDIGDKKSEALSVSPEDMAVKRSSELFKETRDDYGGTLYECLKCDYTIRNLKSMYTHSYKHQPKIFKCYYCDFVAYPRSTIIWHQKQQHFRLKPKVINLV
ncbi:uncharacterized protein [Haliotis asinina]|uniref:uncharacterized protein n=1 Tax=Haliotis asinina TaxID=109174 RepID=UPI0035326EFB